MSRGALTLMLLLAVLVQYAPGRLCAIEEIAVGSSCHDWEVAGPGGGHGDEAACSPGDSGGQQQQCVCQQPKQVGNHQPSVVVMPDWTAGCPVLSFFDTPTSPAAIPASEPDPHRDLLAALQLPLLI